MLNYKLVWVLVLRVNTIDLRKVRQLFIKVFLKQIAQMRLCFSLMWLSYSIAMQFKDEDICHSISEHACMDCCTCGYNKN